MKTTPRMTCDSAADLLALPAVMLGFYPEESTVLVAIHDGYVQACARFDQDWMEHGEYSLATLHSALSRIPDAKIFLLGYSESPRAAMDSLFHMADLLDEARGGIFVTDGERFWDLAMEDPETSEGTQWAWAQSQLAATAVYHGIAVSGSREEAVAAVKEPESEHPQLAAVRTQLQEVPDHMGLLSHLLERTEALSEIEACQLALLLQCEDCGIAAVTRLTTENASHYRERLISARRTVQGETAGGVLGVLGIACWLDGQGAMSTECLLQLDEVAPFTALCGLLRRVHHQALPPQWWQNPTTTWH